MAAIPTTTRLHAASRVSPTISRPLHLPPAFLVSPPVNFHADGYLDHTAPGPTAGLRLYLKTEEGKDWLARAYFNACEAWIHEAGIPWVREGWGKGTVIYQVGGVLCAGKVEGPGASRGLHDNIERDRFILSSAPFLSSLRGKSFRPEKDPGFQVTFLAADEAGSRTGRYLRVKGRAIVRLGYGPLAGLSAEALAAMEAATALLIEPVTTSS